MSNDPTGTDPQDYMAQITASFVASASERLDELDAIIDQLYNGRGDRGVMVTKLHHDIHSMKGNAGTFGFPLVSIICHRLEDYMESSRRLEKDEWLEVQKFFDEMRRIIESGKDPQQDQADAILAALPTSAASGGGGSKEAEVASLDVKVLLVLTSGVVRRALGTALSERGVDVVFVDNPLAALDLSLVLNPDYVVSAQELSHFSGSELAGVMGVLKQTGHIKFALLTSKEKLLSGKEKSVATVIRNDRDAPAKVIKWLEVCEASN